MQAKTLREMIKTFPDDAEISYKKYFPSKHISKLVLDRLAGREASPDISLVFTQGRDLWQINGIKEYEGLPK